MIEFGPLPGPLRETWWTLLDLAEQFPDGWTLIGAQMVALHAAEHDRTPPRSSRDADIVADARLVESRPERIARALVARGFAPQVSADQVAHRFVRDRVSVDLPAPEGLDAARTEILATIPPNRTIPTPGGRQALTRTERVAVRVLGRDGRIPRPSLLGALVVKACAVSVSDHPEDQRQDFAFLCSLISDPRAAW